MLKVLIRKSKNGEAFTTFSVIDNDERIIALHRDEVKRLIKLLRVALKRERKSDLLAFEVKE